jgi:hypothetical protein
MLLVLLALSACATATEREAGGRVAIAGDDPVWSAGARQHSAAREYSASHVGSRLQAPNPAHGLRTYFSPDGIAVHDDALRELLFRVKVSAVGRGAEPGLVPAGSLWSEGSRVEIRRPGLVEWYENSPRGLAQGFALAQRPQGEGPLVIELEIEGARASMRGHRLVLRTPTGRRIVYGHLAARDAEGRELDARLELVSARRLRIVVDDEHAEYPMLVAR